MPSVDVVAESYIAAAPALVAERVRDPQQWRRWWPDLRLTVFQDRGDRGVRWNVGGALVGSAEVWLEACKDGVVVHYYLRADPTMAGSMSTPAPYDARRCRREAESRARHVKRIFWRLKDEVEAGRLPGTAAVGVG